MNKTFTQHAALLWRHLRSETKVAGKHYRKKSDFNLVYSSIFCCKLILLSTLILAISSEKTLAQQTTVQNITVKGTVLDDTDGQGIPGITIIDNAKKVWGVTNESGSFSIIVPKGTTINFTMIGYTTVTRVLNDSQSNLTIRVKTSSSQLNEVVVTALGIKREEKALGYAITKLDSNTFTDAVSSNWTDALSGKVAGLNLVRNSGPAASNKIILRGENNLTGDNEALIVIDGVVASSSSRRSSATGGGVYGTSGDILPVDFGSSINDINPDDIESVTVLKGPAASALYGQRGANGAVMITTKSANKNKKKLGISFTSNSAWEDVNRSPSRQNEFGAGTDGTTSYQFGSNNTSSTYGPAFSDGYMFFQYDPAIKARGLTKTPWVAYQDPVDAFFVTGFESSNSVSLDGTYKGVGLRFSASHGNNEWIVPNTGMERTNVTLNANSNITKKLSINLKAQYSNRNSDNLPATGYGNQSLMYWFIFAQPNINTDWYRDYWVTGKEQQQFVNLTTSFPEGPYAISEQYLNGQKRNGWLGNIQANYKFTNELSLMVRASADYNNDNRETKRPWDTSSGGLFAQGSYRVTKIKSYEINADFMLKYEKKFNKDFSMTASVGGSQMRNEYDRLETRADGLVLPGVFDLTNNINKLVYVPDTARYRINSLYAVASFSYKNYLFLDLTGRQDWNSTLATLTRKDNVGFSYPSASLSFVASDFWKMPKAISFAKLRASYAQVGSGSTTPYRTAYNYLIASNGVYPGNAMTNPRILPNPNLKPLMTTTIELGLDLKLFKNRLNFDFAVYSGNTKNQILSRVLDKSSGYDIGVFNVGRVNNKGLELAINAIPLKSKNFTWTLNGTFSANRNEIKELADSSVILRTGGFGNSGQVVANVGGSMGDLYGTGFMRSPDGQIVFDAVTGYAKPTTDVKYLGNTLPKFRFSFGTGITYKQISTSVLFDAQLGAVGHSFTFARMASLGKSTITLPGRYNGIIGDGVVDNGNGTFRKNDIIATDIEGYYNSIYYNQAEGSIFSTDYLKFREANITYAFNKSFLNKIGFNKLTVGVYGRNLFIWSPWPAFDPEFGTLAGSDIQQGFETGQLPSTRNYGVRLVVGL
ncbi:SusC/RagA family TonB-linked outer membrane protein [Pedobacter boryungensis]|uniref:SusC/RagA family TonB-linked outer membrane protein n=1 Tax=Pedobacter boryungensis TaxID=869962 RepID=A0ABX2DA18_9SPHI|nr:SusC/RagA family TonB-linked outer membrane protein [Pedobacter boryungensis]NQX30884.1 SusC/RagA family TonB-linked outer membrane protein [Pedobacter boryungensis]